MSLPTSSTLNSAKNKIGTRLLNMLLPPLCLNCDVPVNEFQALCPRCWKDVHFITSPYCNCCGAPFVVPVDAETLCGECIAYPPAFTSSRSAIIYDDHSKHLVLSLKHNDRLHMVDSLAKWMKRAGESFWSKTDIILPVPLHRWRLFRRRYNQSGLLAQSLGQETGKPVQIDLLQRTRSTPTQGHMNRQQRQKNIAGVIKLNPRFEGQIDDKIVVLIDDVLTTGATANECSRVLRKAGAAEVHVLTLARTGGFRS